MMQAMLGKLEGDSSVSEGGAQVIKELRRVQNELNSDIQ
jgi:hypothetical protein